MSIADELQKLSQTPGVTVSVDIDRISQPTPPSVAVQRPSAFDELAQAERQDALKAIGGCPSCSQHLDVAALQSKLDALTALVGTLDRSIMLIARQLQQCDVNTTREVPALGEALDERIERQMKEAPHA